MYKGKQSQFCSDFHKIWRESFFYVQLVKFVTQKKEKIW